MMLDALDKIAGGKILTRAEAERVMDEILAGRASTEQIAALLMGLRMRGEAVDEVVGFATAMRRNAMPIFPVGHPVIDAELVDTCGTGGDGLGTFNISTTAAFVVAGAGVRVAKAIEEIGIGFLYAPALHASTRHAIPARRELRMRTIFNLLGPLTNPAN